MDIRLWTRRVATLGALAVVGLGLPACTGPKVALVKPTACTDFSFPVYFEQKSAELTTGAVQVIAASVARAKSCPVAALAISGLGDDTGLAARRAAAIAKALAADGLAAPAPTVQPSQPNHGLALLRHSSQVSVHFVAAP